ncbi:MAG TPA: 2-aminoethylphosphonate--pyruvate transaminase [Trinickia sp.]|uniref:2-aminoethylphosphonate--pyruvate transaminase n=1 Tax=Trinickia sp. TaxID=2571163 RepID=UPI002C290623|nr:2-aminoethylphosphonate--pyruvate transaminase [Trinickia sp.]HVW52908.1 2-aminoethylphosphonate--pyruvate transaminase [Trinickia sp.]
MSASLPILLTPGPLTTAPATREAMLRDWGSWDGEFNRITSSVCADLLSIVHGEDEYVCVPMQGSGTFSVEAALGTLVPRNGCVLVPNNGAYCARIVRILERMGIAYVTLPLEDDEPARADAIEAAFASAPGITHVAQVHLETSAGLLNPLDEIAAVCARHDKRLIVDAMSSFGAVPIDLRGSGIDALISASGKCLEGPPGMGFAIVRRTLLEQCAQRSPSLALDLHDQWMYMRKTGQWRFTPPTHVVAALRRALDAFAEQGGQPARAARYAGNRATLIEGMNALGFLPFLPAGVQSDVIVTFHAPRDENWRFADLYAAVRAAGFILYPGKLTRVDTFRVGCIGAIDAGDMRRAVSAIAAAVEQLGIRVR